MIEPRRQPHAIEQHPRASLVVGRRAAVGDRWQEHILQHAALRQEMMILKDETDPATAKVGQLRLVEHERIFAVEPHAAGRRPIERADDVQQRALARSARPDHGQILAGRKRERHAAEHFERLRPRRELLGQITDNEFRHMSVVSCQLSVVNRRIRRSGIRENSETPLHISGSRR